MQLNSSLTTLSHLRDPWPGTQRLKPGKSLQMVGEILAYLADEKKFLNSLI